MRRYAWLSAAALIALAACGEPTEASTDGSSMGTEGGDDGCADVDCSGHGMCVIVDDEPRCLCDEGYFERNLMCLAIPGDGDGDGDGDTGGLLPDGAPCETAESCASGWCWSEWDFMQNGPGPTICKSSCIMPWDQESYCWSAADCCGGNFCFQGGQEAGFCDDEP